jgi:hypothetical protein
LIYEWNRANSLYWRCIASSKTTNILLHRSAVLSPFPFRPHSSSHCTIPPPIRTPSPPLPLPIPLRFNRSDLPTPVRRPPPHRPVPRNLCRGGLLFCSHAAALPLTPIRESPESATQGLSYLSLLFCVVLSCLVCFNFVWSADYHQFCCFLLVVLSLQWIEEF